MNRGLINVCKSDLGSDKHYLGSSGNKAREKFRAKQEFNLACLIVVMFSLGSQFTDLPCSKCTVKLTKKLDTQRS